MIYAVFDTETTGIPKHPDSKKEVQPRITEFGGLLLNSKCEKLDELSFLVNPGVALEPIITKITGLTDEDVKDEPPFQDYYEVIVNFFSQADAVIAHNLPFDIGMVNLDVERCHLNPIRWPSIQICTTQEHIEQWGRRPKLIHLYEHYMNEPLAQTHRALDDAYALVKICKCAGIFV